MKNKLSLLLVIVLNCILIGSIQAQDAMVVGLHSDNDDGFAIMALKDLTSPIYVTDAPYVPASNSFDLGSSTDAVWAITWTGLWQKGTVIRFIESTSNSFSVTAGTNTPSGIGWSTASGGSISISGGEGLTVFTATNPGSPHTTVYKISSFLRSGTTSSFNPNPGDDPNCPCSVDFVELTFTTSTVDNIEFRPSLRSGSVSLADANNASNWDVSGSAFTLSTTEFSSLTFGGTGGLPIELTSFHVERMGDAVNINWATAIEINNEYFSIEHSTNAKEFESIGMIKGANNSNVLLNYNHIHASPYDGVNYYRLKQMDFDGKYTYSGIEMIDFSKTVHQLSVYPNPFNTALNVDLTDQYSDEKTIRIHDMSGRVVYTNILDDDQLTVNLTLSDLGPGIYILRIGAVSKQIVKQ